MQLTVKDLDLNLVQSGDIYATFGDDFISNTIQMFSENKIAHSGIFYWGTKDLFLIEATSRGIEKRLFREVVNELDRQNKGHNCFFFKLNKKVRAKLDLVKFYKWINKTLGVEYDYDRVIFSALDFFDELGFTHNREDDSKFFCSEYCIRTLEESGAISNINASEITPADLSQMKIYETFNSCQFLGKQQYIKKFNYNNINKYRS